MKCFEYSFSIEWGSGGGIIFADTQERALELIKKEDTCYHSGLSNFKIEEIDTTVERAIIYSYEE